MSPRALLPGAFYSFAYTVSSVAATGNGGGLSTRFLVVQMQPVPAGADGGPAGGVAVQPSSGTALSTGFVCTPTGWVLSVSGAPVRFRAGYQVVGSPLPPTFVTTAPFAASSPAKITLPPGDPAFGFAVTVLLSAESQTGAQAFALAAANVTVRPPPSSLDLASSLAGSVGESDSPDPLAVVYKAQAVGTLLNGADVAGAAQAKVAEDARLKLLSAVKAKAGTSAAKTPAGVSAVASAVATLVADPSQLSDDAKASALASLNAASCQGKAVSSGAAQSIALALGSLAANQTGVSDSVLQGVLGVLGALSSSQAAGLSGLGEPPAVVSTPDIQMATAVNAPWDPTARCLSDQSRRPTAARRSIRSRPRR